MSLTYGFYNSINKDRGYDATQMSKLFDGIINDGVFMSVGDALHVSATTGMTVTVGLGRAWFSHTWTLNDSVLPFIFDPSEIVLNRIDSVILEINSNDDVRANTIKLLKGIPGSFPVSPTCIRTEKINQYPLAEVYIAAGSITITQANITNKVGTDDCPFITGILKTMSIDDLLAQWNAQFMDWNTGLDGNFDTWFAEIHNEFNTWFASLNPELDQWNTEFNTWFATLKTILDSNAAANLLNKINANEDNTTSKLATKKDKITVDDTTAVKYETGINNGLLYYRVVV